MKKIFILLIFFVFLPLHCIGKNVKVSVDFNFQPKNDSIIVAITNHDGKFAPSRLTLDTIMIIVPGEFEIQLQPGTYICKFLHPEIANLEIPLVIESFKQMIGFDLKLEKSSLPSNINSVQLIINKEGDIKVYSLIRSNRKWVIPHNITLPKNIETYVFRVNNSQYYHRQDCPSKLNWILLYYQNIFQGEEIYFIEDDYIQKNNSIRFNSNSIDNEHIYLLFNKVSGVFEESYINHFDIDSARNTRYFQETSELFDQIIASENPKYSQIVIEPYLSLIDRYHPINTKLREITKNRDLESASNLKRTEAYKNMVLKKLDLLKLIDVKSPILSGSFLGAFHYYWIDFKTPYNYIEYDIPFGFFQKLEFDFSQQSSSYYARGSWLLKEASRIRRDNPNRALQLIETLEKDYNLHPYVTAKRTEKLKTELLLTLGIKAPEFELVDMNGRTIKLLDFRGKYVFLDFWGTWCAPCLSELPHLKELSKNISEEELIVIGVACNDKKEKVKKTILEEDLQYLIAMENDKITDDYGVSAYPTTFLINPNGIIVGKNYRGSNLSERIKIIIGQVKR